MSRLLLLALTVAVAACSPLSALRDASRTLDTYTLTPLPYQEGGRPGSRSLFVAEPTAPAAISTDRIVVRPLPVQVTLLPDGRWAETLPAHLRETLTRSFANTGRFALVTSGTSGPLPDYTLMSDVESFEARRSATAPIEVAVGITMTVVRNSDGRAISSRRFARTVPAADTEALTIVSAFNVAWGQVLRDGVPWAVRVMTGG